eukprot:jgi/Galph1/5200/GphlegSOOS_G3868.1
MFGNKSGRHSLGFLVPLTKGSVVVGTRRTRIALLAVNAQKKIVKEIWKPINVCFAPNKRPQRQKRQKILAPCCSASVHDANAFQSSSTDRRNRMLWASAASVKVDLTEALADVIARAKLKIPNDRTINLAVLFVSSRYTSKRLGILSRGDLESLIPRLRSFIPSLETVIGCTSSGVIGHDVLSEPQEVEGAPAVSLLLASVPNTKVIPFHVEPSQLPDLDSSPDQWRALVTDSTLAEQSGAMILLSTPSFYDNGYLANLLEGLDSVFPECTKVGAVASGKSTNEKVQLIYSSSATDDDGYIYEDGMVGILLSGNICMETLRIPSYRQIGPTFLIKKCDTNQILELSQVDSSSIYGTVDRVLGRLLERISPKEKELAQQGILIGICKSGDEDMDSCENYVVRRMDESTRSTGTIQLAEHVYVGQKVAFYVRDLSFALKQAGIVFETFKKNQMNKNIQGSTTFANVGFSFSSQTKGIDFYGEPNYEATLFHSFVNVPLAGIFGGKEIGPSALRDGTLIYEYASVYGILEEQENEKQDS